MTATNSTPLLLPCLRATMGDWIYYVSLMRFSDIAARVSAAEEIHEHPGLRNLLQRALTDRSHQIADYLKNQKQHFFNAIIVGLYEGEPKWYEIEVGGNELFRSEELPSLVKESIGVLHLAGSELMFAIDGQHRVKGIQEALKKKRSLCEEEQTVIFMAHKNTKSGKQRTRRLFSALNRYAKPVTLTEIIALDEDDTVAITTRSLLEFHPLLSIPGVVIVGKTKAVPRSNTQCLTSIQALYHALDLILFSQVETKNKKKFKTLRPPEKTVAEYYTRAEQFLDVMSRYFPPIRKLKSLEGAPNAALPYRNRDGGHLLFRPAGLLSFCRAVHLLLDQGYSMKNSVRCISHIEMNLNSPPWEGLLWESGSGRMITRKENQNIASQILIYMTGVSLKKFHLSVKDLQENYASVLNKDVRLPPRLKKHLRLSK